MIQPAQNLIEIPKTQAPKTQAMIQAWLIGQLADQLQVEPAQVNPKEAFDSYGLSSSQALIIAVKAEKEFGFKLSPVLLWHYPSIDLLSHRLVEEFATAETAKQVFEI